MPPPPNAPRAYTFPIHLQNPDVRAGLIQLHPIHQMRGPNTQGTAALVFTMGRASHGDHRIRQHLRLRVFSMSSEQPSPRADETGQQFPYASLDRAGGGVKT